jgi:hypothetical protein
MRDDLTAEKAHHLLHTLYQNRKRISLEDIMIRKPSSEAKISMKICLGTSCFLRELKPYIPNLTTIFIAKG